MSGQKFSSNANVTKMMEKMVMQILEKNGMLTGNKTFGVVVQVLNESTLLVEMQQSGKQEIVNCTPAVEFIPGDRVLIEFINNNPHDKFIMGLLSRGVGSEGTEPIDYSTFPDEPVEIFRNDEGIADYFVYGYDNPETTWSQRLIRDEDSNLVTEVISSYPDGFVLSRVLFRDGQSRLERYE